VNRKVIITGFILAAALAGGFFYLEGRSKPGAEMPAHEATGHKDGKAGGLDAEKGDKDEHEGSGHIKMDAAIQKENGVVIATAKKQRLGGVLSVTGKIEVNADRIAHVSPRISGKIVSVKASLGEPVSAGQVLASLDSIELGEALNRYRQSRTKLGLAQSNMERIKSLVERKIAARKDILQAETDYKNAQAEMHADEERLSLYGVDASEHKGDKHKKPLLPVTAPISGIIIEKHAIVGELSDPSKSVYTVADLSSVWVIVDINEKDLSKVRKGQAATVAVGAFPDLKLKGRITYIADIVDEATRTVKARVEVSNPGRKLKPEMFATIELALQGDSSSVLAVPEDAIQDIDGKKVLFVAENEDEFEARQVETGRTANGLVEIVSGLKEAECYAGKGAFLLKSELKKGELKDDHGH
jgi:cobalt-zinc-cadmium efflux system membrane fusion protein